MEYKEIIELNSYGQFIKNSFYYPANTLTDYWIYEYPNTTTPNYSQLKTYNSSGVLQASTSYEYDNKHSFYNNTQPGRATHNITKSGTTDATGKTTGTVTVSYQYNSDGYPTQSTYTFTGTSTSTSIDKVTYDCK